MQGFCAFPSSLSYHDQNLNARLKGKSLSSHTYKTFGYERAFPSTSLTEPFREQTHTDLSRRNLHFFWNSPVINSFDLGNVIFQNDGRWRFLEPSEQSSSVGFEVLSGSVSQCEMSVRDRLAGRGLPAASVRNILISRTKKNPRLRARRRGAASACCAHCLIGLPTCFRATGSTVRNLSCEIARSRTFLGVNKFGVDNENRDQSEKNLIYRVCVSNDMLLAL